MLPSTLKRIAFQVCGKGWAFDLARTLGRHPVTVRRWAAGITVMSKGDHFAILKAMSVASKERRKRVIQMVSNVKSQANPETRRLSFQRKVKDPIPPWKKSVQVSEIPPETLPDF